MAHKMKDSKKATDNSHKCLDALSSRFQAQVVKETPRAIAAAAPSRSYGLDHLDQLGLISERDKAALESIPPKQNNNKEWETARKNLEENEDLVPGKAQQKLFSKTSDKNPLMLTPTITPNEQGMDLVLTGTKQEIKSGKYAKCNANLVGGGKSFGPT